MLLPNLLIILVTHQCVLTQYLRMTNMAYILFCAAEGHVLNNGLKILTSVCVNRSGFLSAGPLSRRSSFSLCHSNPERDLTKENTHNLQVQMISRLWRNVIHS